MSAELWIWLCELGASVSENVERHRRSRDRSLSAVPPDLAAGTVLLAEHAKTARARPGNPGTAAGYYLDIEILVG